MKVPRLEKVSRRYEEGMAWCERLLMIPSRSNNNKASEARNICSLLCLMCMALIDRF